MVGGRVRRPGLLRRWPPAAHAEMASLFACPEKLIKACALWPGSAVISNEEAIISSFFLAMIFLLTCAPLALFYLTRDKSLKIKFNYALIEFA
jgi:hypothetical protein